MVRWIVVVVLASLLGASVQRFVVPVEWSAWARNNVGMAVAMLVIAAGLPILRQRFFRSWRGVGAMVLGLVVAALVSNMLYQASVR